MNGNSCLKTCCSESKTGELVLRGQRVTNLYWPLDLIGRLTGLPKVFYQLNRNKVLIIVYHGITDPSGFERQVAFLSRHYRVLPLVDIIQRLENSRPQTNHIAALTFDDGFESVYRYAYPILSMYACPASVFLNTDLVTTGQTIWPRRLIRNLKWVLRRQEYVDFSLEGRRFHITRHNAPAAIKDVVGAFKHEFQANLDQYLDNVFAAIGCADSIPLVEDRLLTWDQVREMQSSGWFDFGNHTASHRTLPFVDETVAEREIDRADRALREQLNTFCRVLAYPNGDYSNNVIRLLVRRGYRGGLTLIQQYNPPGVDLMKLHRIGAADTEGIGLFAMRVSGALSLFRKAAGEMTQE
jgi:peptidoglycan/xylan/chitin deacetylase (PgdA/CDA1 family)